MPLNRTTDNVALTRKRTKPSDSKTWPAKASRCVVPITRRLKCVRVASLDLVAVLLDQLAPRRLLSTPALLTSTPPGFSRHSPVTRALTSTDAASRWFDADKSTPGSRAVCAQFAAISVRFLSIADAETDPSGTSVGSTVSANVREHPDRAPRRASSRAPGRPRGTRTAGRPCGSLRLPHSGSPLLSTGGQEGVVGLVLPGSRGRA
jgi:hypothetical protein